MKKVLVIRYGEIALKGLNRPQFESRLIKNIRRKVFKLGPCKVTCSQSRIYLESEIERYPYDEAARLVAEVFGIVSVSVTQCVDSDYKSISEAAVELARNAYDKKGLTTFKVETKRGNKHFPMQSPEVSMNIGGDILDAIPGITVDVQNPQFIVYIEIRERSYVYLDKIPGQCGMPLGTNGKALLLISGGIDSPVAGWMMARRGVELEALHFATPPYTGEAALEKVKSLCRHLCEYIDRIQLHVVSITDPMVEFAQVCPEEETILHMRRLMMMVSERICKERGLQSIVTGENIGQVASQTMEAIAVTDNATEMPVFRPLIGMDKNDIIAIARKIGTFETSIQAHEDCCTVFVAKHPATRPHLDRIVASEQKVNMEKMVQYALDHHDIYDIRVEA